LEAYTRLANSKVDIGAVILARDFSERRGQVCCEIIPVAIFHMLLELPKYLFWKVIKVTVAESDLF